MKKRILIAVLGVLAAAVTYGATRAYAFDGEACTTPSGRSGYMISTGRDGPVCVEE